MPDRSSRQNAAFFSFPAVLIGAFVFLPAAVPSLFGWMGGLLAVPVFYFFQTAADDKTTGRRIGNGILLAAVGALLLDRLVLVAFALAMLPLGYSLHRSAGKGDTPAQAGGKGALILALSWLVFWVLYGIVAGINPYATLLATLDDSFARIVEIYRNNADLPADVLLSIEQAVNGIREFLPSLLPGLLAGSVLSTVWLNQVIGNTLIHRLCPEKSAWPKYSRWQLPDRLIWLLIAAAIFSLLGSGNVKNGGYCMMLSGLLLYLFQGIAIFVHFLDRWAVPGYFRILLYAIIVIQSYGLLLLALMGVADIWFDFRKLATDDETTN